MFHLGGKVGHVVKDVLHHHALLELHLPHTAADLRVMLEDTLPGTWSARRDRTGMRYLPKFATVQLTLSTKRLRRPHAA
jgi:hypothetical protein